MKRRKAGKRKGFITVTVKKHPLQVWWEKKVRQARRVAGNVLALMGLITVVVLIARAL